MFRIDLNTRDFCPRARKPDARVALEDWESAFTSLGQK